MDLNFLINKLLSIREDNKGKGDIPVNISLFINVNNENFNEDGFIFKEKKFKEIEFEHDGCTKMVHLGENKFEEQYRSASKLNLF